jgi:hypothetical protein
MHRLYGRGSISTDASRVREGAYQLGKPLRDVAKVIVVVDLARKFL